MNDPAAINQGLEDATRKLDNLSKALYGAYDVLSEAEEAWEQAWDLVAEALKTEMHDAGRKGDPAEHTILSATRRENRAVYVNWRRAKREVEKLERLSQVVRSELSGWQSQATNARAELGAQ